MNEIIRENERKANQLMRILLCCYMSISVIEAVNLAIRFLDTSYYIIYIHHSIRMIIILGGGLFLKSRLREQKFHLKKYILMFILPKSKNQDRSEDCFPCAIVAQACLDFSIYSTPNQIKFTVPVNND